MKLAPIFDPDARRPSPKPVQVDLRRIFLGGTTAWLLSLGVCAIMLWCGVDAMKPLIVCASGVGVGVLLLIWEHFNRWDYRRLAQ
ncbi:hypothetical protein BACT_1163 [Bifidobacterium actinocoloniiforme DSM 22766]|uniref:DUF2530 domain-containing protein n=1 Tax=Bifidobacterium actinocoloniiforme DSM 22766 TaxID=1437605 RepID=A0A086Z1Q9_9BIFI|nr:hypothetical protein [Bifidobacterium actinocoloniiforme]AKV55574.1 hypothetical protein AB656_04425 [Bifidobacterium actinocoloniiforme DSM 22766]KFI40459.1 hypothetical protein BACT_1163 [Bifidobacterium actinocoloniiforme DSM 22766]